MKLTTRVSLVLGVLTLAMAALVGNEVAVIRVLADANRRLAEESARSLAASRSLVVLSDEMRDAARKHAVTADPGYARRFSIAASAFSDSLAALDALGLDGEEGAALVALSDAWTESGLGSSAPADAETARLPTTSPPPEIVMPTLDVVRSRVEALEAASRATELRLLRTTASEANRAARIATAALLSVLALGLAVSWYLVRDTSRGLRRLADGAAAVAGGNFDARIDASRRDEFGQLAKDFNRMATRLGELDRMKRRFFAGISHDLKSPLAAVQETTKLLLEEIPGPLTDDQARLLDLSHRSGERLQRMIRDLLDLATVTSPEAAYASEPVQLGVLVEEVGDRFAPRAQDKEVRLERHRPETETVVRGDEHRLRQVVENLLENALRFAPPHGCIELELEEIAGLPAAAGGNDDAPSVAEGPWVLLSVADQGPGVDALDRERIFEQFQRGRRRPADPSSGAPGVGLGLAISREIVEAHGGRIWVEDRPGGGSVFRVALRPLAPEPRTGRPGRGQAGAAAAVGFAAMLALGGCATSTFDRQFEAGRYEAAIATFEADPSLHANERAVFRAALAAADPSTPAFDPDAAADRCEVYLAAWPDTERSVQVRVLRELLGAYAEMNRDRAVLRTRLERVTEQLETLKRIDLGDTLR